MLSDNIHIDRAERRFLQLIAKYDSLLAEEKRTLFALNKQKRRHKSFVEATAYLKTVSEQSQSKVLRAIESLVTMAIQSVYDRPFKYKLELKSTKQSLLAKPFITEDKRIFDDIERDLGGGIIDIISFAQRIVFWSLQGEKTKALFIFDEPFKNLGALTERASQMLRRISKKLNITFIVVTHDERLKENADKVYNIEHKGGKSYANVAE